MSPYVQVNLLILAALLIGMVIVYFKYFHHRAAR